MKTAASEYKNSLKKGFTLIEILVSITVMSLIFGIGIAKYRDFNNSQALKSAAQEFVNNLRNIQSYASSGVKPPSGYCDNGAIKYTLWWYWVYFYSSPVASYNYQTQCDHGYNYNSPKINLPANIIFFSSASFRFLPLGKGANTNLTITLKNTKSKQCIRVRITTSGQINILDAAPYGCP